MRVLRYEDMGNIRYGVLQGDAVLEATAEITDPFDLVSSDHRVSGRSKPLDELRLLAPIRPGKVVAVGLNYPLHATEMEEAPPERPLIFAKFPNSVSGPYDPIVKPDDVSQLDYEVELGVVIGRTARRVATADALDYVGGYVALNDVSARDAQFSDGQWVRGKSMDTFCPMGPAFVTSDEVSDPQALGVWCWVNGELRQDSNTKHMIFSVADLVAYCSRYFTLDRGDVIATGTPSGVGVFMDPPQFLEAGDTVEVEVEGIGRLRNTVVAGM